VKYFYLILLQPANPCNSIISTVTHGAARDRRNKMSATIHAYYVKRANRFECEILSDYDDQYAGGFNAKLVGDVYDYAKESGYSVVIHNYKLDPIKGIVAN
jgi:hypothetical protein